MFRFIVLEGIDGVGKTSVALQMGRLSREGGVHLQVYQTPPTGYLESADFVNNHADTDAHFLFYLSANKFVSDEIKKVLSRTNVVCVRYIYSTLAYHMAAGTKVKVDVPSLGLLEPDFVFYLFVNEEARRMQRIKMKVDKRRGDDQEKRRDSFLWRAEKEFTKFTNLIRVSTDNLSVEETARDLLRMSRLVQ